MYRIKEIADVFVDACIRTESGDLMFLSCYGRDTALQQFLASFSLSPQEGGLLQFTLVDDDAPARGYMVHVGAHERLTKLTGRLPRANLFGNLAHMWIHDPVLATPDRSNRTGWVLADRPFTEPGVREEVLAGVWSLYRTLSPLPLLDDWREVVLRATKKDCLTLLDNTDYPPLGSVTAVKVSLPEDFPELISRMVKSRMIGIASESTACLAANAATYAAHSREAM